MRLSFSTGAFYHRTLDYSLRLARDLGFDGVELAIGPEAFYLGEARLLRAVERVGVPVLSVHQPLMRLPGWPRWTTERLPRMMALARDLGAEIAVTHTMLFYDPDSPRNAHFSQAIRAAQRAGESVTLTIENAQHNRRRHLAYLDRLSRLVNYAQTRGCGVTFDTCHAGASREDLLLDYETVRPLLRNVHLNDVLWRDGRPHTHGLPGNGQLELAPLLERLGQEGYTGLVTLEPHPHEVGLLSRRGAERALSRALDFMRAASARGSEDSEPRAPQAAEG